MLLQLQLQLQEHGKEHGNLECFNAGDKKTLPEIPILGRRRPRKAPALPGRRQWRRTWQQSMLLLEATIGGTEPPARTPSSPSRRRRRRPQEGGARVVGVAAAWCGHELVPRKCHLRGINYYL